MKSHIGIEGNEAADKLATEAARHRQFDRHFHHGSNGLIDVYWPCTTQQEQDATHGWFKLANLQSAVKDNVRQTCQTGNANQTLYVQAWEDIEKEILPKISTHLWTSSKISFSMLRNTLKARYGQLWNRSMAFNRKMAYLKDEGIARDNLCPLCHRPDSIGHFLGGCRHPDMTKSYIARHNEAGRKILKELKRGPLGNQFMIADVGSEDYMKDLGAQGLKLPEWIAKSDTIKALNTSLQSSREKLATTSDDVMWNRMDPMDRLKMRPDILLVDKTLEEVESIEIKQALKAPAVKRRRDGREIQGTRTQVVPCKIKIIEIGYTSDTRYQEKMNKKKQQHAQLCKVLMAEGHSVELLPIIRGTQGSLYKCSTRALTSLQIPHQAQDRLQRRLCEHSIHSLNKIVKQRRFLENVKKPPDK